MQGKVPISWNNYHGMRYQTRGTYLTLSFTLVRIKNVNKTIICNLGCTLFPHPAFFPNGVFG